MIENFLVVRKAVRKFFQKYQTIFKIIFRFILAFAAYDQIIKALPFSDTLAKSILKPAFGVLGAVLPEIVTILLLGLIALYEVYEAAPILAAFVLVLFIVLYCFAARFSGKYAYAIIAIPILFRFNLQYIIPLILGLTATPLAIFPAACGVVFYYIFKVIVASIGFYGGLDPESEMGLADKALALYINVIDGILENKNMIYTIAIFIAVILVMWLVRRFQFEFAFEITIVIGTCVCLIGHFLTYLKLDVPLNGAFKGTIFSMLIVCVVQFFRLILDYSGVQDVQFEDDDYYYYVKAVPKIDTEVPDHFKALIKREKAEDTSEKQQGKSKESEDNEKPEAEKNAKAEVSFVEKVKEFFKKVGEFFSAAVATVHENFKKENKPAEPPKVSAEAKIQEKSKKNPFDLSDWADLEDDDDEPIKKKEVNEKENG